MAFIPTIRAIHWVAAAAALLSSILSLRSGDLLHAASMLLLAVMFGLIASDRETGPFTRRRRIAFGFLLVAIVLLVVRVLTR